jgi:SAM-dependent methyltransferase
MSASAAAARSEWPGLILAASERYRAAGRFARKFARFKLTLDPVFRHMLIEGLIPPRCIVLDIGCGQGLLASLLDACAELSHRGRWPKTWAAAPDAARVIGLEVMPRDVQRAKAALGDTADFICGDMRRTPFPAVDAVVILDVLHYITVPEQDEVLARVRSALPVGGRLLMRVGDAASKRNFIASQWCDKLVTFVRGHRVTPRFGRRLSEWISHLESLGFEVRSQPMSKGTPFANVLLVAQVAAAR